jgi:amino acid transporter
MEQTKLKSVLKFHDVFFVSLGYIVGAGIYSLLHITTKYSGKSTWLAYLIGGIISLMTALTYSQLSEHYDSNASEFDYITNSISKKLGFGVGSLLIINGIIICTTLVLAFSHILHKITKKLIPFSFIITILLAITTIINVIDIKLTTNINMVISIIESSALILLIIYSFFNKKVLKNSNGSGILTSLKLENLDVSGLIRGSFLTIIAFSGFESIPRLAEETQNSKKVIPTAIISSLLVTVVLYSMSSLAANSLLGVKGVQNSLNPISLSFNKIFGSNSETILNLVTLFSIFNTVMLTILFVSRQLYGISKRGVFPKIFQDVNSKTKTPIKAILFVVACVFLLSFVKDTDKMSHYTNLGIFILFGFVNLSALILKHKGVLKTKNKLLKPGIHSILGFIISLFMVGKSIKDYIF